MTIDVAELRESAERLGIHEKEVLRIAAEEGFLRRAALVGGPFVLKGSYVTRQFIEEGWRRIPGDLDWVGTGELNEAELNQWITAVTETELDDGIRFRSFKENAFWRMIDYAMDDDLPTVNTDIQAWVGEAECRINSMDVSFGLKLIPEPRRLEYRAQFGDPFTVPMVCALELQIAWKLHQCLVRPRFKDILDLILLLRENTVDSAAVWQALQDECLHDGTPLERFDWLLEGSLQGHPGWSARVVKDFPGWRNDPGYFSWEPPLAWIYAGNPAIPETLDEFLAALAGQLQRAGFAPVVPSISDNAGRPAKPMHRIRPDDLIQRQVALVSYGTRFLRKELGLEDWCQHGVFFGARLQFRDGAGNALLADDFPLWLTILAQDGAKRLSLHPTAALDLEVPHTLVRGGLVVAVHFHDRYQLWAVGREAAVWNAGDQFVPSAAGDVDCYLCIEERPGQPDVPLTDWNKLAAVIAADLGRSVPSLLVPAEPFYAHTGESASWPKLPLFVATGAEALAHRVLATLIHEKGTFDNDTNPKNDSSYFQHLDEKGAAALIHWGERLDDWVVEVLVRAANIGRETSGRQGEALLVRLQPPPPSLPLEPAAVAEVPGDQVPVTQAGSPVKNKWTNRVGMIVGVAVLSLFILALAKVISFFPWLAALIALPWALYMHYKD